MARDQRSQPRRLEGTTLTVERDVIIQRPIEQVFAFVADFSNEPLYNRALRSVRMISPGAMGVGARWQEQVWLAGTHSRTVTSFESNRALAYRNDGRPVAVENTFGFAPASDGTRLTAIAQVRLEGIYAIGRPVFRLLLPVMVRRVLVAIKRSLESGAAPFANER